MLQFYEFQLCELDADTLYLALSKPILVKVVKDGKKYLFFSFTQSIEIGFLVKFARITRLNLLHHLVPTTIIAINAAWQQSVKKTNTKRSF